MTKEAVELAKLQVQMQTTNTQITRMENRVNERFTKIELALDDLKNKDALHENTLIRIEGSIKQTNTSISTWGKMAVTIGPIILSLLLLIGKMLFNYLAGEPLISLN